MKVKHFINKARFEKEFNEWVEEKNPTIKIIKSMESVGGFPVNHEFSVLVFYSP